MRMATRELMTANEFALMNTGETEDYELVDGELIPLPSSTPRHNFVRDTVAHHLRIYFGRHPIGGATGETDCRLNDKLVRRPDVSIFLGERWTQLDLDRIPASYVPDIAVEVLSNSEHILEMTRKVLEYLHAGSQEVWLLDHANGELQVRTNAGIRLLRSGDVLDSPLLPGFAVSVGDLLVAR
jgi:Uma2 family endonuclease